MPGRSDCHNAAAAACAAFSAAVSTGAAVSSAAGQMTRDSGLASWRFSSAPHFSGVSFLDSR